MFTDKVARANTQELRNYTNMIVDELCTLFNEVIKIQDDRIASLETTNLLLMAHYGLEEVEIPETPAVPAVPARRIIQPIKKVGKK